VSGTFCLFVDYLNSPLNKLKSWYFLYVLHSEKQPGVKLTRKNTACTSCVQDSENISSCEFYVSPVVPNELGKVMKYEAKKIMSIIFLETLNIEWGQIDPKDNRRVKTFIMYCWLISTPRSYYRQYRQYSTLNLFNPLPQLKGPPFYFFILNLFNQEMPHWD